MKKKTHFLIPTCKIKILKSKMLVWIRASFYIRNRNMSNLFFLHESSNLTNIYIFQSNFHDTLKKRQRGSFLEIGNQTWVQTLDRALPNHKVAHQLLRTMPISNTGIFLNIFSLSGVKFFPREFFNSTC